MGWSDLDPAKKRQFILGGTGVVALAVAAVLIVRGMSGGPAPRPDPKGTAAASTVTQELQAAKEREAKKRPSEPEVDPATIQPGESRKAQRGGGG